jgi:anti-anti-sigma factor
MKCLEIEKKGEEVCILHYTGELTLECVQEAKEETEGYVSSEVVHTLVIDLSRTVFLDSSGIGFLVHIHNRMQSLNKKLYLYNLSLQVKKTLGLVKLLDFFHILDSEAELKQLMGEPGTQ